jgi:gluconokinase
VLSNLGVNAIEIGHVAVTIGTSGAMRTVIDEPLTDPHGRLFCYALTEHWVVGGPVNNGGNIFRWVRDELATAEAAAARDEGVDPYEALTRIAEKVRPAPRACCSIPSWPASVRRCGMPTCAVLLRPGPAPWQAPHDPRRAGGRDLQSLYSILPALEELVGPTKRMMATGGFARSALWRQMMADIFNREVVVPESVESSCLGAAVLGAWALGLVPSLSVISGMVGSTNHHATAGRGGGRLCRLQPIFAAIPAKLEAEYHAIAAFQRETGKRLNAVLRHSPGLSGLIEPPQQEETHHDHQDHPIARRLAGLFAGRKTGLITVPPVASAWPWRAAWRRRARPSCSTDAMPASWPRGRATACRGPRHP